MGTTVADDDQSANGGAERGAMAYGGGRERGAACAEEGARGVLRAQRKDASGDVIAIDALRFATQLPLSDRSHTHG